MSNLSARYVLPAADAPLAAEAIPRRERVLALALLASLLLHLLGGSGAVDWLSDLYRKYEPEDSPPLRAVLKPPPPPVYQPVVQPPPKPPPPKPKPKPKPRAVPPPVITAPPVEAAVPEGPPLEDPSEALARESPPPPADASTRSAESAAPLPEPAVVVDEPPPAPVIAVPKRIDLVGTLYIGAQNFMVGTGGFSLRHDGNRYEISVLGRAKGLARLLLTGEFTGVSRGAITPDGLQPSEYVEERGRADRREATTINWEAGVINLRDNKIVPIEGTVQDRLSVIMQFYYRPPKANELAVQVTGTRYVDTYKFRRLGDETLETALGNITAQLWRVDYEDGNPRIELWMSPDYHYLPLRLRIHGRAENGGRFATLAINEIKVEE